MKKSKTISPSKKEKKKMTEEKRKQDILEIMYKLAFIEQENKTGAESVINWVCKILDKEHLKLVHTIVDWLFDMGKNQKEIFDCFHTLKLLILISPEEAIKKLCEEEELSIRLTFYIKGNKKEEICQDVFYILDSIIQNPEELKEYYTKDFVIGLFDTLDYIQDDLNFRAVARILIQINAYYTSDEENEFLSIYKIHNNSRVFNEVIVRLLNDEENRVRIAQIFTCLRNMMMTEQGKDSFFYSNDMESFLDIVIGHLEFYYSEELNLFALEVVEKLITFPDYFKRDYKIEELVDILEGFIEKEDAGPAIKQKCRDIKAVFDKKLGIAEHQNEETSKNDIHTGTHESVKKEVSTEDNDGDNQK